MENASRLAELEVENQQLRMKVVELSHQRLVWDHDAQALCRLRDKLNEAERQLVKLEKSEMWERNRANELQRTVDEYEKALSPNEIRTAIATTKDGDIVFTIPAAFGEAVLRAVCTYTCDQR